MFTANDPILTSIFFLTGLKPPTRNVFIFEAIHVHFSIVFGIFSLHLQGVTCFIYQEVPQSQSSSKISSLVTCDEDFFQVEFLFGCQQRTCVEEKWIN